MQRLSILIFFAIILSCTDDKSIEPLPNWEEGYENYKEDDQLEENLNTIQVGKSEAFPSDEFGIAMSDDLDYPFRMRRLGTEDTPCATGDGDDRDITCVLDLDELDLFLLEMSFEIHVPEDKCDFVLIAPYIFQNWSVGQGPADVTIEYERIGDDSDAGDAGDVVITEKNAVGGSPHCEFDHSDVGGPNCCIGEYNEMIVNHETGDVQTRKGEWGGQLSDCYDGAAFLRKGAEFTSDGWPLDLFVYTHREAFITVIEFDAITVSRGGNSNIYLANYYEAADHDDAMPLAVAAAPARPETQITCVDDAFEIIANIRLYLREWNEEAEFDIDGDPDTTGTETWFDHPIDDLTDFKVLTPGSNTFPNLLSVRK